MKTGLPDSPCHHCDKHTATCHATCPKYPVYAILRRLIRAKQFECESKAHAIQTEARRRCGIKHLRDLQRKQNGK